MFMSLICQQLKETLVSIGSFETQDYCPYIFSLLILKIFYSTKKKLKHQYNEYIYSYYLNPLIVNILQYLYTISCSLSFIFIEPFENKLSIFLSLLISSEKEELPLAPDTKVHCPPKGMNNIHHFV